MKKIFFLFGIISFIAVFISCNKDTIINTHDKVGISKVTYFATITLAGNKVMSIVKGTAFTDPGAKAEAGDKEVEVVTSGTVNANTPGLYTINYSATNADSFSSSTTRTVVVLPEAEKTGVDISGTYSAVPVGSTPAPATITKVAPGVYYTTNCWGNSGAVIPAYFISTDGVSLSVPLQGSPYGNLETSAPGTYTGGLIKWSINLIDQGVERTKQWQKQ